MSLCNVVDKLHDEHGLTYTSTTEESDLTTLHVGLKQVDHLDTCGQDLLLGRQFLECWCLAVDGVSALHVQLVHTVDRLSDNVQHSTLNLVAGWHHDR